RPAAEEGDGPAPPIQPGDHHSPLSPPLSLQTANDVCFTLGLAAEGGQRPRHPAATHAPYRPGHEQSTAPPYPIYQGQSDGGRMVLGDKLSGVTADECEQ